MNERQRVYLQAAADEAKVTLRIYQDGTIGIVFTPDLTAPYENYGEALLALKAISYYQLKLKADKRRQERERQTEQPALFTETA